MGEDFKRNQIQLVNFLQNKSEKLYAGRSLMRKPCNDLHK